MTQDIIVCRFCLEPRNTKKNPLLEPCECKGSIQYVHQLCLLRWRRQDPERNAVFCRLCLSPYRLGMLILPEHIPDEFTIRLWLLRFPIVLCFLVNYPFLFQILLFKSSNLSFFFQAYQFLFQLLYLGLFYREWKVKNKVLYFELCSHWSTTLHLLFHIACNGLLVQGNFLVLIPLNTVLGMYWRRHRNILLAINAR